MKLGVEFNVESSNLLIGAHKVYITVMYSVLQVDQIEVQLLKRTNIWGTYIKQVSCRDVVL